jgi:hypothetical protein
MARDGYAVVQDGSAIPRPRLCHALVTAFAGGMVRSCRAAASAGALYCALLRLTSDWFPQQPDRPTRAGTRCGRFRPSPKQSLLLPVIWSCSTDRLGIPAGTHRGTTSVMLLAGSSSGMTNRPAQICGIRRDDTSAELHLFATERNRELQLQSILLASLSLSSVLDILAGLAGGVAVGRYGPDILARPLGNSLLCSSTDAQSSWQCPAWSQSSCQSDPSSNHCHSCP